MKRWIEAGCVLGLFTLLAGCAQAPPPPPPDTRAADEKAIRDAEATWSAEMATRDVDKITSHYADDATLLLTNAPAIKGKDAIRASMVELLKDPNVSLSFSATSADVSKDIGYTQGTYHLTMTDAKTKKVLAETGKYVTVYKRQADGSWKAVEDINNADAPAQPAK